MNPLSMTSAASQKSTATSVPSPMQSDGSRTAFGAALQAEQRAKAAQADHDATLDAIKTKGFSNWARDVRVEKLKEEIRKKVMAAMGVDEKTLASASDAIRKTIEAQIEAEVQRQMEQAMKDQEKDGQKSPSQAAQTGQTLPSDSGPVRGGKRIPVIPALVTPGAESVLG